MFLHAWRLELPHPTTGAPLRLEAPLPPELEEVLSRANLAAAGGAARGQMRALAGRARPTRRALTHPAGHRFASR